MYETCKKAKVNRKITATLEKAEYHNVFVSMLKRSWRGREWQQKDVSKEVNEWEQWGDAKPKEAHNFRRKNLSTLTLMSIMMK